MHVLLGRLHARKDVTQVHEHHLALFRRTQEFDLVEFVHQIVEEHLHLVTGCALGALWHAEWQFVLGGKLEPLIAGEKNGLCEIERRKRRIDRKGNDAIGECDFLVLQSVTLSPEHDSGRPLRRDLNDNFARSLVRSDNRLGLIVRAGGGSEYK